MTDEEVDDLVETLRSFATAYPEDIFRPLDAEDNKHPLTITRASAQMGRHMAKYMVRAADEIERLQRLVVSGNCSDEAKLK